MSYLFVVPNRGTDGADRESAIGRHPSSERKNSMTNDDQIQRPLDRRFLLRGGAVLAGAAGVTAIGAALGPGKAEAADGQFMVVGQPNSSESPTKMTVGGSSGNANPALSLVNANGPALHLPPTGESYVSADLAVGEIANTGASLDVGVPHFEDGSQTTWLATGLDLDQIPFTFPILPERLVDTRTKAGRDGIVGASPDAFDSKFRLKANSWLDVGIIETDFVGLDAVFVNVTAVKPLKNGVVTAFPSGDRPVSSTLNYQQGVTLANGAFIMCGIPKENPDWPDADEWIAIRIHTTAAIHLVVDLTGVTLRGISGSRSSKVGQSQQRKAAKGDRMKRVFRSQ